MSVESRIRELIKENIFYISQNNGNGDFELEKMPIINKNMVLDDYDRICIDKGNVALISTSGTTGQPFVVKWAERDYIISNMYTWRWRKKWYNILPSDKYCTFHINTEEGMPEMMIRNNGRTLSLGRYVFSEEVISRYISAIHEFEPKWILGPISLIYILFREMKKKGEVLSTLEYVELNGEYVSVEMYNEIVQLCNVHVGNLYGATEFNGIAMRCPYGKMHVLEQNVFIENECKGEVSDIIVSGLTNTVMPLIRYDLGDIGLVIDDMDCPCGKHGKVLELKYGRKSEIIRNSDGDIINAAIFSTLVYKLNIENNVAMQYCVDIRKEKFVLQILINEKFYNYACKQVPWMKRELLKFGINYDIELYTRIEDILDKNSKFEYIKFSE